MQNLHYDGVDEEGRPTDNKRGVNDGVPFCGEDWVEVCPGETCTSRKSMTLTSESCVFKDYVKDVLIHS